jgi:predicted double-glycine peptidase
MAARAAAALAAFVLLCGFTEEGPVLKPPSKLLHVPLVRQRTDFSCGDVSTLAVLRFFDFAKWSKVPEKALYKPLQTSSKAGTDPGPMADYLNAQGVKAEVVTGAAATMARMERSVDDGNPVIVAIQAWQDKKHLADFVPWKTDWDDGHYVVVVGHDAKNLYFMDPSTTGRYTYIPKQQFMDRWHDVLGKKNVHTQHITIFVHGTRTSEAPAKPVPEKVTIIN